MDPFAQHRQIADEVLECLDELDTDRLQGAVREYVSYFVGVQVAFLEELSDLHMQPDAESVITEFERLVELYERCMARKGALLAVEDGAVRELLVKITSAADSASQMRECGAEDLPPGLQPVFDEMRKDPLVGENAELLRSLAITPNPRNVGALIHVLDRAPRKGPESRWKQVARDDPRGFRQRWLGRAVFGCVRDFEHRPVLPSHKGERTDVETLSAAAERHDHRDVEAITIEDQEVERIETLLSTIGLSPRERVVAVNHVVKGRRLVQIAADLGIAPSTARVHWGRAKKKLREARGQLAPHGGRGDFM